MTYTIRFPIGDWSDDGHGKCEYFMVKSNLPVDQVREFHFKAPEVVGFNIGQMCSDYESSSLDPGIIDCLLAIGIDPFEYDEAGNKLDTECWMDPEKLVDIWLDVLKHISGKALLQLDRVKKPDYDDINFYGCDDQNRHLDIPGYGVFYE